MLRKGIKGRICHIIHHYVNANNKYMKDNNKNKESSYFKHWDVNSLHGWAMSQKLTEGSFKLVENTFQFSKDFIKNYKEVDDEGYFVEVDV